MGYQQKPKAYEAIRQEQAISELLWKEDILAMRLAKAIDGLLPDTSAYEPKSYKALVASIEEFKTKFPMTDEAQKRFNRWQRGDHPKLSNLYDLTSMPTGTPKEVVRIYQRLQEQRKKTKQRLKKVETRLLNYLNSQDQ